MRVRLIVAALLIGGLPVFGQTPGAAPGVRYGVSLNDFAFPQSTPQEALSSAIKAIEAGRSGYLLAHLIDPAFVDARVNERSQLTLAEADQSLRTIRSRQKADPTLFKPEDRLPDEPGAFQEAVKAEARMRAFRLLAQDVSDHFVNDLSATKDLKRFQREGTFAVQGETAKLTLRDDAIRAVFLKKVNNSWYVEDRQGEGK